MVFIHVCVHVCMYVCMSRLRIFVRMFVCICTNVCRNDIFHRAHSSESVSFYGKCNNSRPEERAGIGVPQDMGSSTASSK